MTRLAFSLAFLLCTVSLATTAATPTSQMRTQCKTEAGERKGVELKRFVTECVKAKRAENRAAPTEKQLAARARMRDCSAQFESTGKPKSERRAFMRACLKKTK